MCTEPRQEIYDILNPDRGLCSVDGCVNLQRNHGNKRWGKLCEKHHIDPVSRAKRVAAQNHHRMMLKAEKAARAIEYRRNLKEPKVYPRVCVTCGEMKNRRDYPKKGLMCSSCKSLSVRNHRLKRSYGLTETGFKSLLLSQNRCCAICGDNSNILVVDHCHTKGYVRGLICQRCNLGLGYFQDDLDLLASATSYLINSRLEMVG